MTIVLRSPVGVIYLILNMMSTIAAADSADFQVLGSITHNRKSFTQGLQYYNGKY